MEDLEDLSIKVRNVLVWQVLQGMECLVICLRLSVSLGSRDEEK